MNDLISITTGIITGIVSAIFAAIIYDWLKNRRDKKPLHTILNLGRSEKMLFVFPERTDLYKVHKVERETLGRPSLILPFTASEDFLAINNVKSALLKIDWHGSDKIKQPGKLDDDDKKKFIFSIGSMATNTFTKDIENKLIELEKNIFRTVSDGNYKHRIVDKFGSTYISETYEQVENFLTKNNKEYSRIPEQEYIDFGYLTKVTNPYNSSTKIFIIAGIRGIGTWGVAECLKKNWSNIYNKLGKKKDGDFSAAIRICYKNLDIPSITVMSVNMLDESYT